jgi:hypothetical protein
MNISRKDIRLLLLYEFRLDHNAKQARKNICQSMWDGTVSYDTAKVWFQKFKDDDFS